MAIGISDGQEFPSKLEEVLATLDTTGSTQEPPSPRNKAMDEFRDENEGPAPKNFMDVRSKIKVASLDDVLENLDQQEAQLRLFPRLQSPYEHLPKTPSPPLQPEAPKQLPTPPPRGPFPPLPKGPGKPLGPRQDAQNDDSFIQTARDYLTSFFKGGLYQVAKDKGYSDPTLDKIHSILNNPDVNAALGVVSPYGKVNVGPGRGVLNDNKVQVEQMIKEGRTPQEIAEKFDITQMSVRNWIKRRRPKEE
jgi:hypothetical protein